MPSIKSCLVSLAVLALTFAPIVNASSVQHAGVIAARDANHNTRSLANPSAAAGLNKRAAVARALARKKSTSVRTTSSDPYSAKSAFLSTKAAKAAAAIRCNTNSFGDAKCKAETSPPAHAKAICLASRCTFRCLHNYAPGGTTGTTCVAAAKICGTNSCPIVTGGFNKCESGACVPGCFKGFSLYKSGENYKCFSTANDANNCGAPGNVCPDSYNNVGSPRCNNSKCTITCPAGSSLRRAKSTARPFTCY